MRRIVLMATMAVLVALSLLVSTERGKCTSTPVLATSKNRPCKAYTETHKFGTVFACTCVQRLGPRFVKVGT